MSALRLDRAFVEALRDGSLAEHERQWLADQLDAAVDKPSTAVAVLGLERSRQEQSAQSAARNEILRSAPRRSRRRTRRRQISKSRRDNPRDRASHRRASGRIDRPDGEGRYADVQRELARRNRRPTSARSRGESRSQSCPLVALAFVGCEEENARSDRAVGREWRAAYRSSDRA